MPQPIPYLAFNGNCADAMRFYERVLGGKLEVLMSGADSPMAAQIPKEHAHRILHARLRFDDGSYIYAGDTPVQMPYDGIRGATITMIYPSSAEAERVFKSLSEGGKITMPLGPCLGEERGHAHRQIWHPLGNQWRGDHLSGAMRAHTAARSKPPSEGDIHEISLPRLSRSGALERLPRPCVRQLCAEIVG